MVKIIDFYADWCGPCQRMGPIFEQLKQDFKDEDVEFEKVNVDFDQSKAGKYAVRSIPTIVFEKDGSEVDRMIGLRSIEDFRTTIKKHL